MRKKIIFLTLLSVGVVLVFVSSFASANSGIEKELGLTTAEYKKQIDFRERFGFNSNIEHLKKVFNSKTEPVMFNGLKLSPEEAKEMKLREKITGELAPGLINKIKNSSLKDDFAGIYFDQESGGNLVIGFTKKELNTVQNIDLNKLKNSFEFPNRIKTKTLKYSQEQLDNFAEKLFDKRDYFLEQYNINITSTSGMFKEQFVHVLVKEKDEKTEKTLSKYFPIDMIIKEGEVENEAGEVRPGSGINECTVGFPAQLGSEYFVVTAAHCSGSMFVLDDGTYVGLRSEYDQNSGSVDAVGILVDSYSKLSSDLVYSTGRLTNWESEWEEVIGQTVWLQGAESEGATVGELKTTSHSFVYDDTHYYNMRGADYSSINGDSGGTIHNSSELMGVHKGTFGGYKTYSHVTNIMIELGLTPIFPNN